EDVALATGVGGVECTVFESSLMSHHVVAEHAGVEVRAHLPHDAAPAPRSRIRLHFPPAQCLLFDPQGQRLAA
ncbi:MAG: ABC transporter ATP-binding protein, partial [Ramlibacter sp.]